MRAQLHARARRRQHRLTKALEVNTEFDLSRQLWSYLIRTNAIPSPESFIHPVPHMSFVQGADNVEYLRKRHAALTQHHCYHGMEFSEDSNQLSEWVSLVMDGRDPNEAVAATRMITGSDVDYGALTRDLLSYLKELDGFSVNFRSRVTNLERLPNGRWRIEVKGTGGGEHRAVTASSCTSAPGEGHSRSCRSRESRRAGATPASPSAESGCGPTARH